MKKYFLTLIVGLFVLQAFAQQTEFIRLDSLSPHFYYDIRYATTNNFVGEAVYECAVCLLRPDAAKALEQANAYFMEKGYCIQLFDCYRPYPVQKILWEKVPNPAYVADPYNGGSVHNRGAAVDLTLVDLNGNPVDFGTDYDYFGREAHVDYYGLSEEVLANRKLLTEGLAKFGFKGIRTEWWHFSYTKNSGYPISEQPLPCTD